MNKTLTYGMPPTLAPMLAAVLVASAGAASAQIIPRCSVLDHSSAVQQLAYLSRDRTRLTPDCIDAAIRQLGNERYVPAIDVLASYLDFKSPTYTLPADAPVYNPRWGYLYPATLALFEIGPPAVESLVRVIASPSSSDTAGTNAAETLMTINRIDMSKAVTALTMAAKATTDAVAAARLRDAARKLASTCPGPELRTKCEGALN